MSWQSYVDDQLMASKMVKHAVICGHDGNIWAQSPGFAADPGEMKALLEKYGNTEALATSGIVIGGARYIFLSNTDKVIRAKKGTSGIHTIKTTQALIVCVYDEPIVPEQAASVTEKLGEYLISVGY